jgi:adenine phosphoribosyltransferase
MDVGDAISFIHGHADVYRLFDDPMRLREIAAALVEPFRGDATKVAGLEARGFVFATAAALELNLGLVPIRKGDGIFPGAKEECETEPDWRGNRCLLRVQRAALGKNDRVLLVDDWIETGAQAHGAKQLVEACGAQLIGVATVVCELPHELRDDFARLHFLVEASQLSSGG